MPDPLDGPRVRALRLAAQGLRGATAGTTPTDVVRHLGAVQSQELWPALWGVAARCVPPGEPVPDVARVVAAYDDGQVLRTHLLRPTWHLVARDDARWLLELTAPRVHRQNAAQYRREGLTDAHRARAAEALAAATSSTALTRAQCAEVLDDAGLGFEALGASPGTSAAPSARPTPGGTLSHLLMSAELDRAIVSGPLHGRATTYRAFDARVPPGHGPLGASFDRDAALRELVRRHLGARSPATAKDVAAWSALTLTDVRGALAALGDAGEVEAVPGAGLLEGMTLWVAAGALDGGPASAPRAAGARGKVDLLQGYDEYLMGYSESRAVVLEGVGDRPGDEPAVALGFERKGAYVHAVVVDGLVVGRWRATVTTRELTLDVQWYRPPSDAVRRALRAEVERMAAHRGVAPAAVPPLTAVLPSSAVPPPTAPSVTRSGREA